MDDARRIVEESFFKGVNGAPNTKKNIFFYYFWVEKVSAVHNLYENHVLQINF